MFLATELRALDMYKGIFLIHVSFISTARSTCKFFNVMYLNHNTIIAKVKKFSRLLDTQSMELKGYK